MAGMERDSRRAVERASWMCGGMGVEEGRERGRSEVRICVEEEESVDMFAVVVYVSARVGCVGRSCTVGVARS
jgi:hypothetical protein